jgi:hypothetical protein
MKYYSSPYPFDPNIPTEETMFNRLIESNALSDEYTLCGLPLTHMINTLGLDFAQSEINKTNVDGKKIFVCQHILVDKLRFDDNSIVATPHASLANGHVSIPHYPVNVDRSKMKENRSMLFSFMGSTKTHDIRRGLTILYPNNCYDSGFMWGLDPSIPNKKDLNERYIEMLGSSEFSLCPRGTGISSVRLFESMAMGAIPVVIADGYKFPLQNVIKWTDISIQVKQSQISKIGKVLHENYTKDGINDMRERMLRIYDEYLSPDNFNKSIELAL